MKEFQILFMKGTATFSFDSFHAYLLFVLYEAVVLKVLSEVGLITDIQRGFHIRSVWLGTS